MSEGIEIGRFVKDPSLLVELCREVIDQLNGSPDGSVVREREAQLWEISKSIERLEKAGVAVPDVLRGEKTRLAASLTVNTDTTQTLGQLAEEFENILKDLRDQLRQGQAAITPKSPGKRSRAPKTGKKVLRDHIIRALKKLGGRARAADILNEMERQLSGKLLPRDLEFRQDGKTIVWRNNAQWERVLMTRDGTLRHGAPNGFWELNEDR